MNKTFASILGIVSIATIALFIGSMNPKTGFPNPITVDGQTINFTWTDDNTDEDLIIYTDKQTYTDGISHADVYVAVENKTDVEQGVELMGYFRDSKQKISKVSVLTTVTKDVPVYTDKKICSAITPTATTTKTSATTTCLSLQTQTSTTTETKNVWSTLPTVKRTVTERNLEAVELSEVTRKSVESFTAETKSSPFTVPAGGVVYYKVLVEFPTNSDDNFYFEAIGDQQGYGHLDPWFNASWTYKVKIEVVPAKVVTGKDIASFPVYVDLSDFPADFHTNVKGDGCDIRMVESDDATETAFELVSYATSTDTGELHFMADALSTTSSSTFYMYYGNASASCYAVSDTYGRNAVWSNYVSVYHLGDVNDATSNARTLTNTGSVTFAGSGLAGSRASVPSGTNKKLGRTDTIGLTGTQAFSMTMWVRMASETSTDRELFQMYSSGANGALYRGLYEYNGGTRRVRFFRIGTGVVFLDKTGNIANDTWRHIAYTYSGTGASGNQNLYVNAGTPATGSNVGTGTFGNEFNIGGGTTNQSLNGLMDLVKIRGTELSAGWIGTEYNNVSNTDTFYWVGAQETDAGGGGGGSIYTDSGVILFD